MISRNFNETHSSFSRRQILPVSVLLILSAFFSESVHAMRCGKNVISAGRSPGLSMEEIRKKCGAPYAESGLNWIYMKHKTVYKLRFSNVNGDLISINREIVR